MMHPESVLIEPMIHGSVVGQLIDRFPSRCFRG